MSFNYAIKNFGCKVNQYDSNVISENLSGMGNIRTSDKDSDIIIVNTCSVTSRASSNCARYIGQLKEKYPEKEILSVGCQSRHPEESSKLSRSKIINSFIYLDHPSIKIGRFSGHTRAFLKVQQGCKGSCTYCSVKSLKKPFYKKETSALLEEFIELTETHPEIVLCATNFAEYENLSELISRIKELSGNFRWRFSSLPPQSISDNIIDILSQDKRFCPHFHIPLQSGSGSVLNIMKRPYTLEKVKRVIESIRAAFERPAFSLDMIVGFPGESKEDFEESLSLIKYISPVKVHVFGYSPRPNTAALSIQGEVSKQDIKNRVSEMISVSESERRNNMTGTIGSIQEVLIENSSRGYTRGYLPVKVRDKSLSPGFWSLEINGISEGCLEATCI